MWPVGRRQTSHMVKASEGYRKFFNGEKKWNCSKPEPVSVTNSFSRGAKIAARLGARQAKPGADRIFKLCRPTC